MCNKKTGYLLAFGFLALAGLAHAGNIEVSNENKKELKVKIEAEGDSKSNFIQHISADEKSSFTIASDQLNGKSHFSIKGDTSAFIYKRRHKRFYAWWKM